MTDPVDRLREAADALLGEYANTHGPDGYAGGWPQVYRDLEAALRDTGPRPDSTPDRADRFIDCETCTTFQQHEQHLAAPDRADPPVVEEGELDERPDLLASDAYYATPDRADHEPGVNDDPDLSLLVCSCGWRQDSDLEPWSTHVRRATPDRADLLTGAPPASIHHPSYNNVSREAEALRDTGPCVL